MEVISKKQLISICEGLENSNKVLYASAAMLEKFNFTHDSVIYTELLPDDNKVYLIDKSKLMTPVVPMPFSL